MSKAKISIVPNSLVTEEGNNVYRYVGVPNWSEKVQKIQVEAKNVREAERLVENFPNRKGLNEFNPTKVIAVAEPHKTTDKKIRGTITVKQGYRFEAAHRLQDHSGMERHLHGHSYELVLELYGSMKESREPEGMVADGSTLDALAHYLLHQGRDGFGGLDHSVILAVDDPFANAISAPLADLDLNVHYLVDEPTAENLVIMIAKWAQGWLNTGPALDLVAVVLKEGTSKIAAWKKVD